MKFFKLFLLTSTVILFSSTLYGSDTNCIPNHRTKQGTGVIINGDCVVPPVLPYPDKHVCGGDPRLVQGTTSCTEGTQVSDPGPYPPVPSTPCPAGKYTDQGTGECTLNAPSTTEPLPKNMTINSDKLEQTIVSTYDDTPYSPPIDIPGFINENGIKVSIPYTVTVPLNLPARQYSVTIESSVTQNNEPGIILTLAWSAQSLNSGGSNNFSAIITVDDTAGDGDGIFYAKQLDTDETNGSMAAIFPYALDSLGSEGNLTLKIITVIPDRMFGIADNRGKTETHKFLYLPVTNLKTGKTWLSNNLGANYANMNSSEYNITKQATASNDYNAYGSLFQWGRKPDGHELVDWKSGSGGTSTGTTTERSDDPGNILFINYYLDPYDWRVTQDGTLWASEASANNVCPEGYRLPTNAELSQEKNSWVPQNSTGALSSALALPAAGIRWIYNGDIQNAGDYGHYWTATSSGTRSVTIWFDSDNALSLSDARRAEGEAVRCIKDVNYPLNCDDGDACTLDSYDPTLGCIHTPISCDDGDACTNDSCDPATGCCTSTPIDCDDGDACTVEYCDPISGCFSEPISCNDSDPCTIDSCDPTEGCSNTPMDCDDGDVCTTDTCDPTTGCSNIPLAGC